MKVFISLVISIALYFILGIILCNIIYSNIEIGTLTLSNLSDIQLSCYAGVALIMTCLSPHITGAKVDESYYLFPLIVIGLNLGIALAVNHWEEAWEVVTNIIAILFNIVNIGFTAFILYSSLFDKENK